MVALNKKLAAMTGAATLAATTPAAVNQQPVETSTPAPQVQEVNASWYQKAFDYSAGMLGTGIDYVGQGISKVGEGASWAFDKGMTPIRRTGEVARDVGDTLAAGPRWVESKTGIPMGMPAAILRSPGSIMYSITDNASDLLKDLPQTSMGLVGSTVRVMGDGVAANTDGMKAAGQDMGSNAKGLGMTVAGDALPLGLQAAGVATFGIGSLPYDSIARDAIAAGHRITDIAQGRADVSKPVPLDAFSAGKYTYDRIVGGKEYADYNKGNLFSNMQPPRVPSAAEQGAQAPAEPAPEKPVQAPVIPSAIEKPVQAQPQDNLALGKAMADRRSNGG